MICGQFPQKKKKLVIAGIFHKCLVPLSLCCDESEELRMAAQLDGSPRFHCLLLPRASSLFPRLVPVSSHLPSAPAASPLHCMVALTWDFSIPFFPIQLPFLTVFLCSPNSTLIHPCYKPADPSCIAQD